VLAAAIVGRADVIVTINLKDFPTDKLSPFKIDVQHPDEFVSHVLTLSPPRALAAIKKMRARLQRPPFEPEEFLDLLGRQGLPRVRAYLGDSIDLI